MLPSTKFYKNQLEDSMGVTSMVLGILTLALFWWAFFPLGIITGILAVIFGGVGMKSKKGMSIAGLVTGGIGLLLSILVPIVFVSLYRGFLR